MQLSPDEPPSTLFYPFKVNADVLAINIPYSYNHMDSTTQQALLDEHRSWFVLVAKDVKHGFLSKTLRTFI